VAVRVQEIEELLHPFPLGDTAGDALISEDPGDFVAVLLGIPPAPKLLPIEAMSFPDLPLRRYPAIDDCFSHVEALKLYLIGGKFLTEIVVEELIEKVSQVLLELGYFRIGEFRPAKHLTQLLNAQHCRWVERETASPEQGWRKPPAPGYHERGS
jgi:hypothetical protein